MIGVTKQLRLSLLCGTAVAALATGAAAQAVGTAGGQAETAVQAPAMIGQAEPGPVRPRPVEPTPSLPGQAEPGQDEPGQADPGQTPVSAVGRFFFLRFSSRL